jgi:hypothetical protein
MFTKSDWKKICDDAAEFVGVAAGVGLLHKAIVEHQGNKYNSKANIAFRCGACASQFYFAITKVAAQHWGKDAGSPSISCPDCQHTGPHTYNGVKSD